jgi:hypothetical protein
VPIQLTCPCGRKLQIKDEYAGQEGQCPSCGRTLEIPDAAPPPPSLPVSRAVRIDDDQPLPRPPREESSPRPPEGGAAWNPRDRGDGEPIQDHAGQPLRRDADFFVPPPAEIGPILSAYSSLTRDTKPTPLPARAGIAAGAALGGLFVGVLIVAMFQVGNEFWLFLWPVGGGIAGGIIAWYCTRFEHSCSYVGREGAARFVCSGSRENLTSREVFRFRDAAEIRTAQTMHYTNGAYTHTSFSSEWTDVGGRSRYTIAGTHKSKENNPPSGNSYHFAQSAELAWTIYLLDQAYRQIELSGSVLFNLKGGRWIRLGQGRVILGLSREPEEVSAEDLEGLVLQQGVVSIRRRGARQGWFKSSGVYQFQFNELANARLFFHMVEKVVGIPIS